MALSSTQPEPSADPNCQGQHAPAARMAVAASLCASHGEQIAELRRQILKILLEADRPIGAYELIDTLSSNISRRVAPPTEYRALEFPISQRLVAKFESWNAYISFAQPECDQNFLFFICNTCGKSFEWEGQRLDRFIVKYAS